MACMPSDSPTLRCSDFPRCSAATVCALSRQSCLLRARRVRRDRLSRAFSIFNRLRQGRRVAARYDTLDPSAPTAIRAPRSSYSIFCMRVPGKQASARRETISPPPGSLMSATGSRRWGGGVNVRPLRDRFKILMTRGSASALSEPVPRMKTKTGADRRLRPCGQFHDRHAVAWCRRFIRICLAARDLTTKRSSAPGFSPAASPVSPGPARRCMGAPTCRHAAGERLPGPARCGCVRAGAGRSW